MNFEEALKTAKETAFKDYDDECKYHDCDNGYNATRIWNKDVYEKYTVYTLSGTPPKAYLVIFNGTNKIECRRKIQSSAFAVFEFEEEPDSSSSGSKNKNKDGI